MLPQASPLGSHLGFHTVKLVGIFQRDRKKQGSQLCLLVAFCMIVGVHRVHVLLITQLKVLMRLHNHTHVLFLAQESQHPQKSFPLFISQLLQHHHTA